MTAGRAEKRKEAERAVLAVSSGGESHLNSRRLAVSQGLIAKRSGHLVGESPRRGTPKGVSSAEGVLVRDTSWSSRAREENGLDVSGREAGRRSDQGRDGTSRGSVGDRVRERTMLSCSSGRHASRGVARRETSDSTGEKWAQAQDETGRQRDAGARL